jgi:hypothetical protein
MRKITILNMLFAVTFSLNAQQVKRNLVANANFEEGLKNWLVVNGDGGGVVFSADYFDPISGTTSAKFVPEANAGWSSQIKYRFPVERGAKYKISFKAKASETAPLSLEICENHDDFFPFELESAPDGFTGDGWARGNFPVGTEVREYTFITQATPKSDWGYVLNFYAGEAVGTSYWIDDVVICRADEDDWDGNLFPQGDFETDPPLLWAAENNWPMVHVEVNTPGYGAFGIEEANPLSGSKSLWIEKYAGVGDLGAFWNLAWFFSFYANEDVQHECSFAAKSNMEGLIDFRTNGQPWGIFGPDLQIHYLTIKPELQHFVLNDDNANDGCLASSGFYGAGGVHTGHLMSFTSFYPSPAGFKIWIDDFRIAEKGLVIEDFDVLNVPATLAVTKTAQLTIGNIYPTHAPSQVSYSVENGTGQASIDNNGILTGVAAGTVTVRVVSADGEIIKSIPVTITGGTAIASVSEAAIYLYPNVVERGDKIKINGIDKTVNVAIYSTTGVQVSNLYSESIDTDAMAPGVYMAKIKNTTLKFIVK